jgi:hypothetical protein
VSETGEMRVSAATRLTGLDVGFANLHDLQRVILWDIGPEEPKPPQRPLLPKGQGEGDPAYDLAKVEFARELQKYEGDLVMFARRRDEYAEWQRTLNGPVEREFWSVDAADALNRDLVAVREGRQSRRRWYLSSRTRGSEKLSNRGLPEGMAPGRGQSEIERRRIEENAELEVAMRSDPVFGGAV